MIKIKDTDIYNRFNNWRWRERKVSYGNEYPEKTFYVIRRHASRAGLFSFVMTNLGSIAYAVEKGYVPVIDMMNSVNPMLSSEEVGRVNAWEKYFFQPCGYGLEDIKNARNIILDNTRVPDSFPDMLHLKTDKDIEYWRAVADRYLKPLPSIEHEAEEFLKRNAKEEKVLGVLCRGTDYIHNRPKGHPIQPDIQVVINEVKSVMKKDSYDIIYLATEDESIWMVFNSVFKGQVISYQKEHYRTEKGANINDVINRLGDPFEKNREYLTSIVALSKSNGLIAGAAGGTVGAILLSKYYEYCHIYRLGVYE